MLNLLPDSTRPVRNALRQRALLNSVQSLLQLRSLARTNNNRIAIRALQRTMECNPSVRQRRLGDPRIAGNVSPFIDSLEQTLFAIHACIHISNARVRSKTPFVVLRAQLGRILHEETAGDGGICVEADLKLVEEGEEVFLDVS